jgi:hypothetical protein
MIAAVLRWLRFWLWRRPLARLRRESFYIDARGGNDDWPGTVTAPMRTLGEFSRRIRGAQLRGDLFLQIEGDFSDEKLELELTTVDGAVLTVAGGTPAERRRHARDLKRMHDWTGYRGATSRYPTPPASVGCLHLTIERGRAVLKHIHFKDYR